MGVIHKLKPEVVDFVVQQKKDNPQLSCRKVVVIVNQNFNLQLSKSSVNEIWKEANLSSPIGRRAGLSKAKAFKIPTEKRQQLFVPGQGHPGPETTAKSASPVLPKPKKVISSFPATGTPGVPVGGQEHPVFPKAPRASVRAEPSGPFDGMGSIFLKIAEWEMAKNSLLGQALAKSLKGYDAAVIEQWAKVLLLMPFFGVEALAQLPTHQGKGLWIMGEVKKIFDFQQFQRAIETITDFKELQLNLLIELEQANQWVGGIKMSNDGGDVFWLDNEWRGICGDIVQYPYLNVLQNVMNNLSCQFIANVQSVVLENISSLRIQEGTKKQSEELFGKSFGLFLAAMEAVPGRRLKNMTLYNSNNEELVSFDTLPEKRRIFISALRPSQKEFQLFLASADTSHSGSIFLEELGKDCVYQEVFIPVENLPALTQYIDQRYKLRGFLLKDSLSAAPLAAIITNATVNDLDARQVLSSYLLRWPNFMTQPSNFPDVSLGLKTRLEEIYTADLSQPIEDKMVVNKELVLMDLAQTLRKVFLRYCQWQYFSETASTLSVDEFQRYFCSLSGYLTQGPRSLLVKLVIPSEYPYPRELSLAIQRINEGYVVNPDGRRLFLSC